MQAVRNVKSFIEEFQQRLTVCYKHDWHSALYSYDLYSDFKRLLVLISHLCLLNNINGEGCLARFRNGTSALKFCCLQYRLFLHDRNKFSPVCSDTSELEVHFLSKCPKYKD